MWDLWRTKSSGEGFFRILRFSLPNLVPLIAQYSLIILSSTLYKVDNESIVKEAVNKEHTGVYLAHLDVVVDGRDVQRTAAVIVGGVHSVRSLGEEPTYQILAPRHDGLVQWVVAPDVTDPQVGAVRPQDA